MALLSFLKKKTEPKPMLCAVLLAAGSSERFGEEDKQRAAVDGVPVLVRSLLAFENCPDVERIVIATRQDSIIFTQDVCREYGISKVDEIVSGGETRLLSALIGVRACGECDYVAIHDGARPLVTPELISRVFGAAVEHAAAVPAVPTTDTIKHAKSGLVQPDLPPRGELFAVQTPQIFDRALISAALQKAAESGAEFTDDASAVEAMGMSVFLCEGEARNIKITKPQDIAIAEAILQFEEDV